VVEGMGRVFARKFGVCGKALPDYELSWLQIWQHELATREADAIKARRVSRRLRLWRNRPGMGPTLIRMSNKGSAWHRRVVLLLMGDDPGLARRMPERGTTGNQPSASSTYGPICIVARRDIGQSRDRLPVRRMF
jgi:hypothetical protein